MLERKSLTGGWVLLVLQPIELSIENPTATMGRVIGRQVPTDYFTAKEYAELVDATITWMNTEIVSLGLIFPQVGLQIFGTPSCCQAARSFR